MLPLGVFSAAVATPDRSTHSRFPLFVIEPTFESSAEDPAVDRTPDSDEVAFAAESAGRSTPPFWLSCAFGIPIVSNFAIPGLREHPCAPPDAQAPLRVTFGIDPPAFERALCTAANVWYRSPDASSDEDAGLIIWRIQQERCIRFRFFDGTEFTVHEDGTEVWATWPPALSLEDTTTYLLGPIAGFILRIRGVASLHASVVVIDGEAVALVGAPGAGKSTTAAAFALRGHPVLTDDLAPLVEDDGRFMVQPSYPRLRLWPESAEMLLGSPDALPRLTPTWDKLYLPLGVEGQVYQDHPMPLAAIYLLGTRESSAGTPRAEAPPATAAFVELTAHLYTSPALRPHTRAADFGLITRLVTAVPVRRAIAHGDAGKLDAFLDCIIHDFRALRASEDPSRDV